MNSYFGALAADPEPGWSTPHAGPHAGKPTCWLWLEVCLPPLPIRGSFRRTVRRVLGLRVPDHIQVAVLTSGPLAEKCLELRQGTELVVNAVTTTGALGPFPDTTCTVAAHSVTSVPLAEN